MKKLLFLLLIAGTCLAGLPPTTTKDSTDSNPVTTFNFEFPNFTGTHTGTAFSLGVNGIAGGGTNEGSQTSNGVCYYDGTGLTTGSSLTWDGNALTSSQVIDSGLTASTPIYANGLMQLTSGTFSGNTTEFATVSGAVTSGHIATWDASGNIADGGAPATGTVTAVSVTSANGLAGSSSGGATPALTLSTTVTGLVKGNGTALSAAVADTDYQSPITLTTTGTSGAATFIGNILNVPVYAGTTYTASDSLSLTGSNFTLLNDSASPANSSYYGTDGSGTLGYHLIPNTTLTVENQAATTSVTATTLTAPNNQVTANGVGSALIETGNKNLLANPSFEASTTNVDWTMAGSGVSAATDSSNFHDGLKSLKLTFSSFAASTLVLYQSVTPTATMSATNGEAGIWVDTTVANLQVCALAAGSVISGTCNSVPASGNWVYVPANFVFPSSGSSGVGLYSSASIASGTANVDEGYLGEARNIGTVAQAQLLGTVTFSGCSSGWSISSPSNTPANFSSIAGCTVTVTGQLSSAGNIPGFTISSGGAGAYKMEANGQIGNNVASSTTGAYFRFSDGTNVSGIGTATADTATGIFVPNIVGTISESSNVSNLTIQIQGGGTTTSSVPYIGNAVPLVISVYYFPTQSQTVASLATVSANASYTSTLGGTTASTSFSDPTSVSGAITVSGTPHNISCVKDASLLGVDCTLPRLGNFQVCYGGYAGNSTSGDFATSELTDGSNTVIVAGQTTYAATNGVGGSVGTCGNYTATSTSVVFKQRGYVNAGSGTFDLQNISITQIDSPGPTVLATGNVSSTGAGQYHVEAASLIINKTSSAVLTQTGNWISYSSYSSPQTTFTFTSGEFSSNPVCSCTVFYSSASLTQQYLCNVTGQTGGITVVASSSGGGEAFASNFYANIICMGPH